MSEGKLELAKSCLLTKLFGSKGQKQPEKSIKTYVQKQLSLDAVAIDAVVEDLVRDQVIARQTKGKTTAYQLTPAAGEYQKTLPAFPPPPPPPDEKLTCLLLMELAAAGDNRLVTKELAASVTAPMKKTLGLSKPMVSPAMAYFVSQHFVDEEPTGKAGKDEKTSYRATERGKEELAKIPESIASLFPHLKSPTSEMKNFVLMEMLAAGDRRFLKPEIEKIVGKPTGKSLGLIKPMAGPLLVALGREKLVDEEVAERSGKASYLLTARGKTELARGGQNPAVVFNLNGAAINELLRHAGAIPASHVETTAPRPDNAPHTEAPPSHAPQFSDDALIDEAKDLLRERHGHTGLVPIFELRRRIREKFGEQPATHAELDGRIKRLRRESRLRLVSISDRSQATAEQLSESVPGDEEMFFYVGELR